MKRKLSLLFSIALVVSIGCDAGTTVSGTVDGTPAVATTEHAAVEFTSAGFESEVLNSPEIVLVDCWAPW